MRFFSNPERRRRSTVDVRYDDAIAMLQQCLPETREAVDREYEYAKVAPSGPHTVYDEVLNQHLNRLLDSSASLDELLQRAFGLVETLATSSDPRVRDIVAATICPNLIGEPRLAVARRYMGPATLRILKRAQRIG